MRVSGSRQQTLGDVRGSISLGGFTDFGRGNPPRGCPRLWVPQEGRHGGATPTQGRGFPSKLKPY